MMKTSVYLTVAGVVFGLIAVLHALRFFLDIPVQVGATALPMWPSLLLAFATAVLSVWAFWLLKT